MKNIKMIVAALAVGVAANAMALDSSYIGITGGYYDLDSNHSITGGLDTSVVGVQAGVDINDTFSFEYGYGLNVGGTDADVITMNIVQWLTPRDGRWTPYLMLGANQYDFNDTADLVVGHEIKSEQYMLGAGLAKMISDNVEFRGDLRMMTTMGAGPSSDDYGLQFSLNRRFGVVSPAPAVAVKPAPLVEPAPLYERHRTVTIDLKVEFEFDKAVVRAIYGDELKNVAAAMVEHKDIDLVLEGHTDSRGPDAYNKSLSQRRAEAVEAWLIEQYGIDGNRITSVGYGESRPVDTNDTAEGRAHNRRVVGEMSYVEVVVE